MNDAVVPVFSMDGQSGMIDPAEQPLDGSQARIWITLTNGKRIWVPWDMITFRKDGSAYIPLNFKQAIPMTGSSTIMQTGAQDQSVSESSYIVLPIIEEQLSVHKRPVETGKVRLNKQVSEHEEIVDEPGFAEHVHIERVPMDKILQEPATVRQEGDTTIIPIMEEVMVVEKRLILKEEVRVTKEREEVRNPQHITLRSEELNVERLEGEKHPDNHKRGKRR